MKMSKIGWAMVAFIAVGIIFLCSTFGVESTPLILGVSPIFGSIPVKKVKQNKFNLSHEKKLSLNMGNLVPVYLQEIIPGDKFRVNTDVFIRLAPMLAPIMHRVNCYIHYFYVPNRLLYADWQEFITGGKDNMSQAVAPYINVIGGVGGVPAPSWTQKGSVWDYFGLPTVPEMVYRDSLKVSALPFRAYDLIYREYYADKNLIADDLPEFITDGGECTSTEVEQITTLKKRAWEKDYFTSALPTAQLGEQVKIPVYAESDAERNGDSVYDAITGNPVTGPLSASSGDLVANGNAAALIQSNNVGTINDFRRAEKLQQWLEKAMRGGGRYKEFLYSFFNVNSSDLRLQRPEYLGGGKQGIIISEVLANAYSVDADANVVPQGNQSGHGISAGTGHGFTKFFEEHGYVLGIMSIIPRTAYQNGINRMWTRTNKLDYFWPEFAHIGEQAVMSDELFVNFGDSQENHEWGYQSRYAEYKFNQDTVHGDFRDNLDFWHMGRKFTSCPELNQSFIESDPTTRIFAVTDPDVHHLYCQVYHNISAIRKMPIFGTPSI